MAATPAQRHPAWQRGSQQHGQRRRWRMAARSGISKRVAAWQQLAWQLAYGPAAAWITRKENDVWHNNVA